MAKYGHRMGHGGEQLHLTAQHHGQGGMGGGGLEGPADMLTVMHRTESCSRIEDTSLYPSRVFFCPGS